MPVKKLKLYLNWIMGI